MRLQLEELRRQSANAKTRRKKTKMERKKAVKSHRKGVCLEPEKDMCFLFHSPGVFLELREK